MAKPDEKQSSKEEIVAWALDRCRVTAGMPVLLSAVFDAAIEMAAQRIENMSGPTYGGVVLVSKEIGAEAIRALKGNAQGGDTNDR